MGARELVEEPRLAHAGLADHRDDLAMTRLRLLQRPRQLIHFGIAADEAGEPAGRRRLEPRAHRSGPHELEDLDGRFQAPDRNRPDGSDLYVPLGETERRRGEQRRTGLGHLLHPRGEMGGLPDGRVIHVEIAADGSDHNLPGVEPDPDLNRHPVGTLELVAVSGHRVQHPEGGVAGPHRVILVSERRAEQRHDAVAHDLVDRALVTVDRLHHPLEDRVQQLPALLGIALGQELHGALEVGEEDGDLLALAFERALGGEDFLGEVSGGVRLGRGSSGRSGARGRDGVSAREAESGARRQVGATCGAGGRERSAASEAEACVGRVVLRASRALHSPPLSAARRDGAARG